MGPSLGPSLAPSKAGPRNPPAAVITWLGGPKARDSPRIRARARARQGLSARIRARARARQGIVLESELGPGQGKG